MHAFELPSGIEAALRPITGNEESLLTDRRLMKNGAAVNQVLLNCLESLGGNDAPAMEDVLGLLSGDRLFLLVKLRQISFGDEVTLSLHCPDPYCGEDNPVEINLEDLTVTPYPAEREFRFKLPKSEKEVVFIPLDGHMEKRLVALKNPGIHSAMLMRIKELGGKPPTRKTFLDLPAYDLNALRAEMRVKDGGIDTVIKTSCLACGAVIQTRLEAEPAFLFPQAATL